MLRIWWSGRAERERLLLSLAAATLLVLGIYLLVWEPMQKDLRGLRQRIDQQTADLMWMRTAAAELKRLQNKANAVKKNDITAKADTPSLLTLVDQTAKLAGLGGTLKRLEPQGSNQLRVQMEQIGFDALLLWLSALQNEHGLILVNASMNGQAAPGRVDARLVLQR